MTLAKKQINNTRHSIIKIGDDEIKITNHSFSVSDDNWQQFKEQMKKVWDDNPERRKSQAMRILVNAVNLGIIDLEDLWTQVNTKAEQVKEIIYV